jgi:hypothetical protein
MLINMFIKYGIWKYKLAGVLPNAQYISNDIKNFVNGITSREGRVEQPVYKYAVIGGSNADRVGDVLKEMGRMRPSKQGVLDILEMMGKADVVHCEKSLFVLASRQKIPALRTEIPAVDTRTICLLPLQFF